MNGYSGAGPAGGSSASVEGQPSGGLWISLVEIFVDPQKVFHRIAAGLAWWKPWIVIAVLTVVIAWIGQPVNLQVAGLNPRDLPPEQLEAQLDAMRRFGFVGLILAPLAMLLIFVIIAAIVNITVNLASGRSGFKKVLCLMQFAGLIGVVEQGLRLGILHMKGIETIESSGDARVSFGMAALPWFSEAGNFARAVMDSLSVFQIWYLIVFTLGIAAIFRISRGKAVAATVVVWVISIALLMLQGLSAR
ncbi:MAG: YIP1 family protein [Candidatus Krumholzibacteria bacterium]|nr:YIP1 family protein [Candidatus Krumholzibacteria bacterium]